ncbi:MAG: hypothetical protein II023_13180 [Prevotella sp.]|nr:hypothetical protein [Prevotella sp.]
MQMGGWKGTRVGLYCYNLNGNGGKAQYDYFHYQVLE